MNKQMNKLAVELAKVTIEYNYKDRIIEENAEFILKNIAKTQNNADIILQNSNIIAIEKLIELNGMLVEIRNLLENTKITYEPISEEQKLKVINLINKLETRTNEILNESKASD